MTQQNEPTGRTAPSPPNAPIHAVLPSGRTAPSPPNAPVHAMMCVDGRCAAKGSEVLHARIWDALEQERLAYYRSGGTVRFTASSCLGSCDFGPTLAIYTTQTTGHVDASWHHEMSESSILRLLRSLHAEQQQIRNNGPL
jgi:(2Fe-2S) ferredoxin